MHPLIDGFCLSLLYLGAVPDHDASHARLERLTHAPATCWAECKMTVVLQ